MADPYIPPRRLVDVTAAADYLSTSERHVRALIERRAIPYHKVGALLRLDLDDLESYLAQQRVEAVGR